MAKRAPGECYQIRAVPGRERGSWALKVDTRGANDLPEQTEINEQPGGSAGLTQFGHRKHMIGADGKDGQRPLRVVQDRTVVAGP